MTIEKPSDNETNKNEAGFEDLQKATEGLKKEKIPEQEINEINQQISEMTALIEKEKNGLAEIRAKLELPETHEESVSIKSYQEKIKNLITRRTAFEKSVGVSDKIKARKENKTEKEETKTEKIKPQEFDDFIAAIKKLSSFLKERDSQKLSSLTEDPGKIAGAVSALESSLVSQNPDIDSVVASISRIADVIGELGKNQPQTAIRESAESLGKLAFILTNIDKERQGLGGRIGKKENASGILTALSKIGSITQGKRAAIYQKLDLLKRYGGR